MNKNYGELLDKIKQYCLTAGDISALAVIGSRSAENPLRDDYSDIDLVLITGNPDYYYNRESWLSEIGEFWISFKESVPELNHWERRAIFSNALDVDFVILDEKVLLENPDSLVIAKEICSKKMNILMDKNNHGAALKALQIPGKPYTPPSREHFLNVVNDFYFHYLWAYKKLLRGEYWTALQSINGYLNTKLLLMMEWYEHAVHGEDYYTFYNGRYLEKWIEPELLASLPDQFSGYNPVEMEKVLQRKVETFTGIARKTASIYNHPFPEEGMHNLLQWVEVNYVQREH